MKVKLTKIDGKELKSLLDDDFNPKYCPLKPPVPTQNNLGSISLIEFPCTSNCVCFETDWISSPGECIFKCSALNFESEVNFMDNSTENTLKLSLD